MSSVFKNALARCAATVALLTLFPAGADAETPTPRSLLSASILGGEYLIHHQNPDGRFNYGYRPAGNEYGTNYNHLRHAGTTYALLELYEATNDPRFLEAGRKGVEWLTTQTRGPNPEDEQEDFLAILSPKQEAKLGGAALALLAICKYETVSGDASWRPIGRKLARFILFMQDDEGQFESKYFYREPDEKKFVSMYYPGEAVFALCRLHRLDPSPEILEAAARGADWLTGTRDAGKPLARLPHDHWLLMGLDELHGLTGEPRFLDAGARIAEAILSALRGDDFPDPEWRGTLYTPPRSTPCSVRGEALSAMISMAKREDLPIDAYLKGLIGLSRFVIRCQIDEEEAATYENPEASLGGVKKSLVDSEIRIDYVQHAISMWLGLRRILMDEESGGGAP